ncbi:MAG: rRNA adenine N(6)-methyltransferase family protein [Desulfurococcales archaeon]|nr:rRNA adenine N(6)-methyltransferase family protein [Desulfurococcales archaeon]
MPLDPTRSSRGVILSYIRGLLQHYSARPRRVLGQSFLIDPRGYRLFKEALSRAGVKCGDMLEIGSGPGLLTCVASPLARRIVSVELDRALALASRDTCREYPNVQVMNADGSKILRVWRGSTAFSNTPYHLTSKIISVAAKNNNLKVLVLGMQKELALRIVARPGEKDYGRLTVLSKLFFEVNVVGFLDRRWFYPLPEVDGMIVHMKRKRLWEDWMEGFEQFTACLFSQRNKKASKVVLKCTDGAVKILREERRVRDLPPEKIIEVYKAWALRRS